MPMKKNILGAAATIAFLTGASTAYGVTCIAGQAATSGSNSAYEQAKKEIEQIEEAETSASSEWTQCLGSISGQVGWPTFPSAGEIFDQIKQEICKIAQQSVNDKINQVNNNIDEIYNQIPDSVNLPVVGDVGDSGGVSIGQGPGGSLSDFYEGIWQ